MPLLSLPSMCTNRFNHGLYSIAVTDQVVFQEPVAVIRRKIFSSELRRRIFDCIPYHISRKQSTVLLALCVWCSYWTCKDWLWVEFTCSCIKCGGGAFRENHAEYVGIFLLRWWVYSLWCTYVDVDSTVPATKENHRKTLVKTVGCL